LVTGFYLYGVSMIKNTIKSTLIVLLFVVVCVGLSHASLKKKTVIAEGIGVSLNQAIYDALDEAVGRVNGKSIESHKQLESIEISNIDGDNENYFASEVYQAKVKSATKGVVDSYEILSKNKEGDGLYKVNLSVNVLKFVAQNNNRKRIAVFPMRIGQGRFTIKGKTIDKERVVRLATQNLVTTLVQSRRFTVLDREYMTETVGEQRIAMSPNAPVEEMARLGQEMVADYIMVGTIESLGYEEQKIKMQGSGRELIQKIGNVEIGIRLVDVATRQVAYSDFLKLRVSEEAIERFGGSFRSEGIDASISMVAADNIGRKILETIYPLVVVSVNGEILTIGQGGSQIKEGDRLEIFMYGKRLTDPYTNEFLGREEVKVGTIQITRVNSKQSHARIIKSIVDISQEFEPKKFICRAQTDAPDKKQFQREERRKDRNERRKKKDDDW